MLKKIDDNLEEFILVILMFAMTALMQVFFKVTEGQQPDPEWDARLDKVTGKFRELKDRAASWSGSDSKPTTGAPVGGGETQPLTQTPTP